MLRAAPEGKDTDISLRRAVLPKFARSSCFLPLSRLPRRRVSGN